MCIRDSYNIEQGDNQPIPNDIKIDWGLSLDEIKKAQSIDKFCKQMLGKLQQEKSIIDQAYHIGDDILRRMSLIINGDSIPSWYQFIIF